MRRENSGIDKDLFAINEKDRLSCYSFESDFLMAASIVCHFSVRVRKGRMNISPLAMEALKCLN
jgi:hypothetical protein